MIRFKMSDNMKEERVKLILESLSEIILVQMC